VFLESVLDPADDAALLELCSTRWFPGIASLQRPNDLSGVEKNRWVDPLPPIMSWSERLSTLQPGGNFDRSDLDALRTRVAWLRRSLDRSSVLGWLMDCDRWFDPRSAILPSDLPGDATENARYGRGFDHLVTLLDENFADAPISSNGLLEWLRLQIATNDSTDEPDPNPGGTARVTVVTVHKSKGLEYDRVVIPHTEDKFEKASGRTEAAVVADAGSPRLIWKWLIDWKTEFTNVRASESKLWDVERDEKVREEARLLYVAMTRAREELEVVAAGQIAVDRIPNTWAQLLGVGS
jgi:superfamily I DNA/RNA helicase